MATFPGDNTNKNILLIGNGFDLAHELPTKWIDFLNSIKNINTLGAYLDQKNLEELKNKSSVNFWIKYFENKIRPTDDTWIDFESEMLYVIKILDEFIKNKNGKIEQEKILLEIFKILDSNIGKTTNGIIMSNISILRGIDFDSLKNHIDKMLIDLNELIRCLEIYLDNYISKLEIKCKSPDIQDVKIGKIISFNYTDTYQTVYNNSLNKKIEYDFLHGKADINRSFDENNMVLGIDEYLDDDLRNKKTLFIHFKKYFQRIHKKTDCKYKEWISKNKHPYNLYIFGHSLGTTDGDVIKELINNSNLTTIFYHNHTTYGNQIANLVQILGQNNLINKVSTNNPQIIFKKQKAMKSI